ncbi:hypothetical protein N0V90_005855 [Kalmusia sp. IMI 367209]|nr:hypothetical protein N0V90_005855 [Kalmusia sp. IMI 367209]
MQFTKLILALGFSAIALAAPAPIQNTEIATRDNLVERQACSKGTEATSKRLAADTEAETDADTFYITGC